MKPTVDECLAKCYEFLTEAGFELGHESSVSEAKYWSKPGFQGYLRVASHGNGRATMKEKDIERLCWDKHEIPVLSNLLINHQTCPGRIEATEQMVAQAIGMYILRQNRPRR